MRIAIGQFQEESNTFVRERADVASHARIVVVKSALQFRDGYGDFARGVWVVDTPGPSTANLSRLEWHHLTRPLYPFDDDFDPRIQAVSR